MKIALVLLFIGSGIITILGAVLKWSFFVDNYKARFFKKILGETGMRIFYVISGGSMCVLGILMAFGVWP